MTLRAPLQTRIPRARRIECVFDPGQDSALLSQLRGQDKFFGPAGYGPDYDYHNPRGRPYPVSLRTWSNSLQTTTLVPSAAPPFRQSDYPNPRGRVPAIALRTWIEPLKLNLIGQDAFFGGPGGGGPSYDIPNPVLARTPSIALRQWQNNLLESTLGATGPATPITSGGDTWSLTFSDAATQAVIELGVYTELNPWTLLPGALHVYQDLSAPDTLPIDTTDTWGLAWSESPTDSVFVDTWDIWSLKWTEAPASLSVTQTFTANDTWALTWLEVASVFSGAPIAPSVTDTWSLTFDELSLVAATVDASDTWSITLTDSGSVDISSDTKTGTDTWSLQFSLESGFFTPVVELPILSSDEWRILFVEVSNIVPFSSDVGIQRVITMRAMKRVLRKQ